MKYYDSLAKLQVNFFTSAGLNRGVISIIRWAFGAWPLLHAGEGSGFFGFHPTTGPSRGGSMRVKFLWVISSLCKEFGWAESGKR